MRSQRVVCERQQRQKKQQPNSKLIWSCGLHLLSRKSEGFTAGKVWRLSQPLGGAWSLHSLRQSACDGTLNTAEVKKRHLQILSHTTATETEKDIRWGRGDKTEGDSHHGKANVSFLQSRSVVGPVSCHSHHLPLICHSAVNNSCQTHIHMYLH